MKISELKEKIANAGGSLEVGDMIISHKPGDDINIHERSAVAVLISWVRSASEDEEEVEKGLAFMTDRILKNINGLAQLAQFLGIEVKGIKPIEIPVEVVKEVALDDPEKHKLAGKVEAYENILIGRSITAS